MLKLKKSIKVFFLLITAVVLSLGLLACDKNGKIDPNKTYYDVTNSCKLTANYVGKNFLKDGIGEATLTRISDGDTASFKTSVGDFVTIRFYGVDTPESTGQVDKWGVSASLFVKGIINKDTQFVLESSTGGVPEKDSYGVRYLGYVWYRNSANEEWKNLNLLVVENGYSKQSIPNSPAYVYYPYFKNAETFAKDGKLHIWGEADDPNYSDAALNVTLKDLNENIDLYWNIENKTGSKVRFEAIIVDLRMGDTGTHTFTAAQIIDGKLYKFTVYTGYASGSASSYLKIGNKYDMTGFVQEHEGSFQVSGLSYVMGEKGEGFTSVTEKQSYIMFNSGLEYIVRYDENLKTDATVTNASLEGTMLTLTVAANTVTMDGVELESQTYTITVTVSEEFDVNTVTNKKVRGNVYKNGDVYTAMNLSDLSFN